MGGDEGKEREGGWGHYVEVGGWECALKELGVWVGGDLTELMNEENTNDKLIMLVKLLLRSSKKKIAWKLCKSA